MKNCFPDMIQRIPECQEVKVSICIPKISIVDKKAFHFIDGSSLKLKTNITDCQGNYRIKWETSLPDESLQLYQGGEYIIIDRKFIYLPKKYLFKVILYESNNIVSYDTVEIEFIAVN